MSKYALPMVLVVSLTAFAGCGALSSKSAKSQQDEHLALINQKIHEVEQVVANLNASSQYLGKRVEELSQKTATMDTGYSKINDSLGEISAKFEEKDNSLQTTLSDVQKSISDLDKKIGDIESVKADLQNQIAALQAQKSRVAGSRIEQRSESMREETKELIEQGREMIKEAKGEKKTEEVKKAESLATEQGKEALQKLLDEALAFYRGGNYAEAIKKWGDALVIDPANLEAKFNIEIAKDKIKSPSDKEK